eukprot:356333-Chlamydomonas_euryale.AAC.5
MDSRRWCSPTLLHPPPHTHMHILHTRAQPDGLPRGRAGHAPDHGQSAEVQPHTASPRPPHTHMHILRTLAQPDGQPRGRAGHVPDHGRVGGGAAPHCFTPPHTHTCTSCAHLRSRMACHEVVQAMYLTMDGSAEVQRCVFDVLGPGFKSAVLMKAALQDARTLQLPVSFPPLRCAQCSFRGA